MTESSDKEPTEGELDHGGTCAGGFTPLRRRSPLQCLFCCIGTHLTQEESLLGKEEGLQPADLVAQKCSVWLCQGQKLVPTLGSTTIGDAVPMLFALLSLPTVNRAFWCGWKCTQRGREQLQETGSLFLAVKTDRQGEVELLLSCAMILPCSVCRYVNALQHFSS